MVYRRDFRRNGVRHRFLRGMSVTNLLIMITAVIFFAFLVASFFYPSFISFVALKPSFILSGIYLWTLFSSIFMHGSFFHLFVNMLSLFFLGNLTEQILGRRRFIWFYIVAGIVGSLFFVLFAYLGTLFYRGDFIIGGIDDLAVGASGAIFGLLGILATLLPRKRVYLIVGPLIVIIIQVLVSAIPNVPTSIASIINIASGILIFVMIFSMFSSNLIFRKIALPLGLPFWLAPIVAIVPLLIIGFFIKLPIKLPIGNMAHFGGLVAGLFYGAYLRNKYKHKVKLLNKIIK